MSNVRRAIFVSLIGRYAGLLITLISVIIISRLLTPNEIGIFSVSVTFTVLAGVLKQFGVGNFLIQKKELTQLDLRACFTVSLTVSWALALFLLLARYPIARFYNATEMTSVIALLAINFLFTPFGVIATALLRREMKFGAISVINLGSAATGAAVSISTAYLGASYMALAWGAVATSITEVIITTRFRPREVLYKPTTRNLSSIFSFGSITTTTAIIGHIGIYAPDLILGRVISLSAVAYFSRAQTIVRLFQTGIQQALSPVAQSYLAQSARHSRDAVRADYLKTVTLITGIAWPFFGSMAIVSGDVIEMIFGPQWTASIGAAQVLCLASMIHSPTSFVGSFFLALGEVKRNLIRDAILQPVRIVLILITATISLEAVAWAIVATHGAALVLVHIQLRASTGMTLKEHFSPLKESVFVSVAPIATCLVSYNLLNSFLTVQIILLAATGFLVACAWVLSLRWSSHPLRQEFSKIPGLARLFGSKTPNQEKNS